jgi:hypothetical protein
MNIKNVKPLRWFGINGIVLWPFVLYADKDPNTVVQNHESIHLAQIRRAGVLKFYGTYLSEYARGRLAGMSHHESYMNISFEREAYQYQQDQSYLAKNYAAEIKGKIGRT